MHTCAQQKKEFQERDEARREERVHVLEKGNGRRLGRKEYIETDPSQLKVKNGEGHITNSSKGGI